jgi:hypothetical protein
MGWWYGSGFGLSSLPVPTRLPFGVNTRCSERSAPFSSTPPTDVHFAV